MIMSIPKSVSQWFAKEEVRVHHLSVWHLLTVTLCAIVAIGLIACGGNNPGDDVSDTTRATLSNLTISSGNLSPAFASGTTTYTAAVDVGIDNVTVTPTASNANDTMAVTGTNADGTTALTVSVPVSGAYTVSGLTVGANTLTITATAADGTDSNPPYTIVVTRPADRVTLIALEITPGALSFSPTTNTYDVNVINGTTEVMVTPTASDANATIAVAGTAADGTTPLTVSGPAGGAYTVSGLTVGSNTITIVVENETYTINVRQAPRNASSVTTLNALSISPGTLDPTFASGTNAYAAASGVGISTVMVTQEASDDNAAIAVSGTAADGTALAASVPVSGAYTVSGLTVGDNTITIGVVAEDGTSTETYTIIVTREPSNDATLSDLAISPGTLDPTFASGTSAYTASVDFANEAVAVTPAASDATIGVTGTAADGTTALTASAPVNGVYTVSGLTVGDNTITIGVVAEDGTSTETYTITVTRELNDDATLSDLTINSVMTISSVTTSLPISLDNDGTYDATTNPPSGFVSNNTTYYSDVEEGITEIAITPTTSDDNATIMVTGSAANFITPLTVTDNSGVYTLSGLTFGANTITIDVTAQDGITTQRHNIFVTRAGTASSDNILSDLTLRSVMTISSVMTINPVTLSPAFDFATTAYDATVLHTDTDIMVIPTANDPNADIRVLAGSSTVNGPDSNGIYTVVGLNSGSNNITITVTAEDSTFANYTIKVDRLAPDRLHTLTVSEGTLDPVFDPNNTGTYEVDVPYSTTELTVTPMASDPTATIETTADALTVVVNGGMHTVQGLPVGRQVVDVRVTAGGIPRTYAIAVTRAPNNDATLSALTIDMGTLTPAFASGTKAYTASVGNVGTVSVTPTENDAAATIEVSGTAADGTALVSNSNGTLYSISGLTAGLNTITIGVTAQDGNTKDSYAIGVTRAAP